MIDFANFIRSNSTKFNSYSYSYTKSTVQCGITMSASADFNNPLRKFKLVFLGEQSGKSSTSIFFRQGACTFPETAVYMIFMMC